MANTFRKIISRLTVEWQFFRGANFMATPVLSDANIIGFHFAGPPIVFHWHPHE